MLAMNGERFSLCDGFVLTVLLSFCPPTASRRRHVPFPTALIFHHVLLDLVLYRNPAIRSPELSKGLFRISVCPCLRTCREDLKG